MSLPHCWIDGRPYRIACRYRGAELVYMALVAMTTVERDGPIWMEFEPEKARLTGDYGRAIGMPNDEHLHVWVRDANQKGQPPVRVDDQIRRWKVTDDQIEIDCAGGTIRATPDGESDPAHGRVSGRVTETVVV